MAYQGEYANKAAHSDIVKNPDVAHFLEACGYLTSPSEEEGKAIGARFQVPPPTAGVDLAEQVIAFDGSSYEAGIDDRLPSPKVGFVKVSSILIDMAHYTSLRVQGGRFVDPFRVADLQNNNSPLTFALPSANIRWQNKASVRDSFRASVDDHLFSAKTRFTAADPATSLRTTLFHLAARRPGRMGTADVRRLKIPRCPDCSQGPIEVADVPGQQPYPGCGSEVYPADCLRLWEEVSDSQSNAEALARFMMQVEHLLPVHYLRFLVEHSLASLGSVAFFIDGPLAIFGPGAWLHSGILRYLDEVNQRLAASGQPRLLLIGLQKTGQVVDHARLIGRFVQPNRIFALDDPYRYRYILQGRAPAVHDFGAETYYGQDFIYKTNSGRLFIFALPYPFATKTPSTVDFSTAKTEPGRYRELSRAVALLTHVESDLYENAIVPIALAHRYTAISLIPGGRVLDLLTRKAFHTKG